MAALGTCKILDNLKTAFAGESQANSEVQRLVAEWLDDYNHMRPPSSLNNLTPMQFAHRHEASGNAASLVAHPNKGYSSPKDSAPLRDINREQAGGHVPHVKQLQT